MRRCPSRERSLALSLVIRICRLYSFVRDYRTGDEVSMNICTLSTGYFNFQPN